MAELTEFLIKSIVTNKDNVSVKEFGDDEDIITIEVVVDEKDKGRVIGKNGRTIKAIKTIVQASSFIKNSKKVNIEVDSI